MRSHTVSAEGGAAAVIRPEDSLDAHAYDTISGGDWLCDQDAVELFVRDAPEEMLRLEHWGCPWSRNPDGTIATRPFGGMKIERTWFAADKTGFHLLHALFQTTLSYPPIERHDEWFATRPLVEDGRCHGVMAIDLATGKVNAVLAKAVILCTGGGGKVFPYTTNANIKTGDGMALAYRAVVPLKDMEFVQYHPTGLPFTGILITEAARAEGGWLLNKDGYRYLQDYDLGEPTPTPVKRAMELGPRDRLSQAFVQETKKGRTVETPRGHVVHYMMGGIHTDVDGATPLEWLYAAGETACVNINGANRLGSNSLTELLVFGARAGHAAAEFAAAAGDPPRGVLAQALDEEARILRDLLGGRRGGKERVAPVREALQRSMEDSVGIYRDEAGLRAGLDELARIRERFQAIALDDRSQTFNTELVHYLELESLIDVAEAMVQSALDRKESRGAHQRTDHPERDDDRFLAHTLCPRGEDGQAHTELLPVTITRWPPAERVYGV
jgi:fumarate reductase flavoprotein subunit